MSELLRLLEESIARSNDGRYVLRLYVTGQTPRSQRAIANLRALCDTALADRYELTVIDLLDHPDAAQQEHVVAAPTLVKAYPPPLRRLIGDLTDRERLLVVLDLEERSTDDRA